MYFLDLQVQQVLNQIEDQLSTYKVCLAECNKSYLEGIALLSSTTLI